MAKVATLGEVLVEIVAERRGEGFREPMPLIGPYPSGAPAIFIDQVARLGQACGIISCVGEDDFGRLNVERLRADGADVSAIRIHPDQVTGSAFVRYREDGERDFVFNIKHSACGHVALDGAALTLLDECGHFHVMGSSLFAPRVVEAMKQAVERVRARGGTVSFDPNVRKEMLRSTQMRASLGWMLRHCDIFLPSGPELTLLTEAGTEDGAIREVLSLGVSAIVVKRGIAGSSYHDARTALRMPGFPAREVDPTGAGDCFGATFVTCRLQGRGVEESLRYANASGARTVAVQGPMEGASTFAQLDHFLATAGAVA